MLRQGSDTAGFWFTTQGNSPASINPGTLISPFGIPGAAATVVIAVVTLGFQLSDAAYREGVIGAAPAGVTVAERISRSALLSTSSVTGAVASTDYQLCANLHLAECNWLVRVGPVPAVGAPVTTPPSWPSARGEISTSSNTQ